MAGFERLNKFVLRTDDGAIIAEYDEIRPMENGLTFVRLRNKGWGVVNASGKEIIEPQFQNINDFENGFAVFMTSDGHQGVIDEKGNITIPANFWKIYNFNEHHIAIARKDYETYNLINETGKQLFNDNFKSIKKLKNGFFDIENANELHAVANPCGKIITPFNFVPINDIINNYIVVKVDKETQYNYGVIDSTTEEQILNADYAELKIFENGFILALTHDWNLLMFDADVKELFNFNINRVYFKTMAAKYENLFKSFPNVKILPNGDVTIPRNDFNI